MIHSQSGCNSWSWADPKSGSWSLFWVSHMGAGSQGFGPPSMAFLGNMHGAGWEVELPGLEQAPVWDPGAFNVRTLSARPRRWAPRKHFEEIEQQQQNQNLWDTVSAHLCWFEIWNLSDSNFVLVQTGTAVRGGSFLGPATPVGTQIQWQVDPSSAPVVLPLWGVNQ